MWPARKDIEEPRETEETLLPEPMWWTKPHIFMMTITAPMFGVILLFSDQVIRHNQHGYMSPNYITPFYVALFCVGLLAFGVAAYVALRMAPARSGFYIDNRALDVLFWCVALAYLVWFGPLMLRDPGLVIGALTGVSGASYRIRELNLNISGVTTVTQFGITYVCIYAVKKYSYADPLPSRFSLFFAIIIGLALFRAVVNSERIALLELAFPFLVFYSRYVNAFKTGFERVVIMLFPLITLFGSTFFFAVFEYNRSWIIHYQYLYKSIFDFAFERLSIYYVSSINNICGFLTMTNWPTLSGQWTFSWLYRFPILGPVLQKGIGESRSDTFSKFLSKSADEQFNNQTGILTVFDDWGLAGGLIFLLLFGFIAGRSYLSFARAEGGMQYAYGILFYAIYECLRIGYIYDGRGMSAVIGLVLVAMIWGRRADAAS